MTIGIIKPILRDPAANPSCFPFRPAPALLVLFPIPIVLFPRQLHIPPFPDPKLRMILYRESSAPPQIIVDIHFSAKTAGCPAIFS